MRRSVALAVLLGAGVAHAEDARDVFGFKKPPSEAAATCEMHDGEGGDARLLGCVSATDPFDAVSPYALRTWLPSSYLLRLPVADATHDSVAHFAMGASRDEAGPFFAGASGLENRWTIEGAPADNLRNGNVETRVPLTFIEGMLVTAGGFAARDRTSLGGTIDVELRRGGKKHVVEAYAWTGLSTDQRERPIANATFQLRRVAVDNRPEASASVVATGPLPSVADGTTWYAAGIAPALRRNNFSWHAARLVDRDQDGIPDGLPGKVELETIEDTSTRTVDYSIPMMARVGWKRGVHDVALTLIGAAASDSFFLANATQQAAGVDRSSLVGDGIATWKGSWADTRARFQLAWHRSVRRESAQDARAAGIPQFLSIYVPTTLDDDPLLASACDDGPGDEFPMIPNCVIPFGFFASAGAGRLVDTVGDRPSATADVAHRYGDHVLRVGGTFEDTRLVTTSRYTGGELVRSIFAGHTDVVRFLAGDCDESPAAPCAYAAQSELNYRTRYTAAYIEDTFTPVPRLRIDGGMRWELMWVGPRLHFSNELAPRIGFAFDPFGNGQSRAWASLGRSFAMLPAGLGPTVIGRDQTVRDVDFGGGPAPRIIDRGSSFSVADGIQPAAQDEFAMGFELGVVKIARAGVWLQHRSLRRGLDTVLANSDTGEANFDNPGRDGSIPARRESTVLALEAMISPAPKISIRASYMYGRSVGSWTGPFDPRQGAALYAGTDWDLDASNLEGRLPTDVGHRVFVEAERRGSMGNVGLALATRLTVTSGRPRNVLADSDLGIVELLPRGSYGRGPVLSQANVRLSARWREVDFTLDVFDVFDRREVTNVDEIYAGQQVRPIIGGTAEDLLWIKNDTGTSATPANRRTGFGLPTAFQSPLSAVLGIHRSF